MSNKLSDAEARGIAQPIVAEILAQSEWGGLTSAVMRGVRAGYAAANLAEARREAREEVLMEVAAFTHDDPNAITYQSLGQYRTALQRHVNDLLRKYAPAPEAVTLSDGSVVTDDPRNGENRIKWERDGATAWYAPEEVEVASRALPDTDRQAFLALAQRVEGQ